MSLISVTFGNSCILYPHYNQFGDYESVNVAKIHFKQIYILSLTTL